MSTSYLSQRAVAALCSALHYISRTLGGRLQLLAGSELADDACEAATAALYLVSSAANPAFTSRQSRVRSFQTRGWDDGSGPGGQSVEDMVESGFYHVGDGSPDHVKCFFCDLGLKDWEPGDAPEREHAKFSPLCFFLKSSRGLDWVRGQCSRAPNFPASYTRQDHNKLLETLCQEFASTKATIAAAVGHDRTAVLLQIARSFIRRRERLTTAELVLELQNELERVMGVAEDSAGPWYPVQFDLATVADEYHGRQRA